MKGIAYSLLLKVLYPTSLGLILLFASAVFRRRQVLRRACFWTAIGVFASTGNGWVVGRMTAHLERLYPAPDPMPVADAIVILSGGIKPKVFPRPTVEIDDAGDWVLYGAHLFRDHKAPWVLCTGGIAGGGVRVHSYGRDMAELLREIGVPAESIVTEDHSRNTAEHARNLQALFEERKWSRILLVTSAIHMPRALGVFRKSCPNIEFVPAPTDFLVVDGPSRPWYSHLVEFIPTPKQLLQFSDAMHEYVGIAYYRFRGWI